MSTYSPCFTQSSPGKPAVRDDSTDWQRAGKHFRPDQRRARSFNGAGRARQDCHTRLDCRSGSYHELQRLNGTLGLEQFSADSGVDPMRVPESRSSLDPTENMMTSMIDVVFLLLIFFLVAAAGRRSESKLPVDLGPVASAGGAATASAEKEEVWIRAATQGDGLTTWTINDTEYRTIREVRDVLAQLAELQRDMPVILDIGPEVPAEDLVAVYDSCRDVGLDSVNFNLAKVDDE